MDSKVLRLIFTLFVGAILALFIGFGIHTFARRRQHPISAASS